MSMMREIRAGLLLVGVMGTVPAFGQMGISAGGRPLGGYGASTIGSYYGSGGGYVPYSGRPGMIPETRGLGGLPVPRRAPSTPIGGASSASARGGFGMDARSGRRRMGPGEGMGMG